MALPGRRSAKDPEKGRLKAVALRYEKGPMRAPRITAKGKGLLAEKILGLARTHGVPVREDRFLVEALEVIDVGQDVPAELYQVVAEILVAVHRAERQQSNLK
jgi:flagellar biosynthesis protein